MIKADFQNLTIEQMNEEMNDLFPSLDASETFRLWIRMVRPELHLTDEEIDKFSPFIA